MGGREVLNTTSFTTFALKALQPEFKLVADALIDLAIGRTSVPDEYQVAIVIGKLLIDPARPAADWPDRFCARALASGDRPFSDGRDAKRGFVQARIL